MLRNVYLNIISKVTESYSEPYQISKIELYITKKKKKKTTKKGLWKVLTSFQRRTRKNCQYGRERYKNLPEHEGNCWLSIAKIILKCGKTLHNNQVIHNFFISIACFTIIFITCMIYMTASKGCGLIFCCKYFFIWKKSII